MNLTSASDTIVQEITIKGSAERIFEALANPDARMKWWGAEGRFQVTHIESDLRPGGKWVMRGIGMGGKPFTVAGEYRKIERPRLLVFTWLPDWYENATESLVHWDLEEKGGRHDGAPDALGPGERKFPHQSSRLASDPGLVASLRRRAALRG